MAPLQCSGLRRFLQERELWFPYGANRMRYLHIPARSPDERILPAMVFVHGLMGYSFSWRHNLDFFSEHRDVYAVDLLGIGQSDRPKSGAVDFGLPATAARLLGFLRSLGHSEIDLVATSHGGAVAMLAASQDHTCSRPVICRLVLVAPAHPFMPNARLRLALFRTPLGRIAMRGMGTMSRLGVVGAALQSKGLADMYANASRITPETRAGYAVNLADPRSYDYALGVIRSWRTDMQQLRAALPSIANIPVLLLWGAEDRAVSADSGRLLREFFRDAQYVVLPNVGHLPYEEAPDEFNRRVMQFLEP